MKPTWINKIKVLVWDVDGTLYQDIPVVRKRVRKNVIALIAQAQAVSLVRAEKLFSIKYRQLNSSGRTMLYYGVNRDYVLSGKWHARVQLDL